MRRSPRFATHSLNLNHEIQYPQSAFGWGLNHALLTLLLLGVAAQGQAETTVFGTITGQTWTEAGSPYLVNGDLLIASLTIQPGVEVRFQGNYVMEVAGRLTAVGTAQKQILFTTAAGNTVGWRGLFLNQSPRFRRSYIA